MACRLFGDKPLSKPMMVYCQLDLEEYISMSFFFLNWKVFIQENVPEDICNIGGYLVSALMC